MRRSQAAITVTAAVPAAYWAAAMLGAPAAVMTILGIALAVCPGYVWAQVLLSTRVIGLERVAVAAGLSLALPVLGGVALNEAGIPLERATWAGLLASAILVGDALLLGLRRTGRRAPPSRRGSAPRLAVWHAAALGAAVVIAAGAVGLSIASAAKQANPGFTQLWLSTSVRNSSVAALGVSNHQGSTARYRLILLRQGHVSATWNLTLSDGQAWQRRIPVTGGYPVAARLYRLPDLTQPYRYVTIDGQSPGP
jgi:hypothetical protein